jgi:hypothetical protein
MALLMQKLASPVQNENMNRPTYIVVEVSMTLIRFEKMAMPLAAISSLKIPTLGPIIPPMTDPKAIPIGPRRVH